MSFLKDYVFFNSGNECPESFHLWAGLAVMSSVIGQKVMLDMQYFDVATNIYVCLVGDSGGGKSIARKIAKNVIVKNFPNIPMSASVQSAEDLAKKVANSIVGVKKSDGTIHEYHPYSIFVNEMESYLRVDARKMIALLVDMYDAEYYDTGFKKDSVTADNDKIPNPCLTMLACTTPKWIMDNLKLDLFSGGLGRRLIIVYEQKTKSIAWPTIPEGGPEAYHRCVEHLKALVTVQGTMVPSEAGRQWYKHWYEVDRPKLKPTDPILLQFYSTKHINLLKIAMLLTLADPPPFKLVLEPDKMELALAMLNFLEPAIPRLSAGAGKNPLAMPTAELLETLVALGGAMTLVKAQKVLFPNMAQWQIDDVLRHLESTEQIKIFSDNHNGLPRRWLATPEKYAAILAEQKERAAKQNAGSTSGQPDSAPPGTATPTGGAGPAT